MTDMTEDKNDVDDLELALALRRLAGRVEVPPIDPLREAALMGAFDAACAERSVRPRSRGVAYWGMAGLATAAALLIAVGLVPVRAGRHGTPSGGNGAAHQALAPAAGGTQPDVERVGEFVLVPGAAALPPIESGQLVRMDVPVSMLLSLGVTPPANAATRVRADLIVGQDGLTRAIRLVN